MELRKTLYKKLSFTHQWDAKSAQQKIITLNSSNKNLIPRIKSFQGPIDIGLSMNNTFGIHFP